jgi:hypothetical protein
MTKLFTIFAPNTFFEMAGDSWLLHRISMVKPFLSSWLWTNRRRPKGQLSQGYLHSLSYVKPGRDQPSQVLPCNSLDRVTAAVDRSCNRLDAKMLFFFSSSFFFTNTRINSLLRSPCALRLSARGSCSPSPYN